MLRSPGRRLLRASLLAALALPATTAAAQEAPPPSSLVAWQHDTGWVRNDGKGPEVVASFTVQLGGARWLRLRFDQVLLAGDPLRGDGAILRVTSHRDGAVQELNAIHARQWRSSTAYFNGDAVQVDLVAFPGTGDSRLVLAELEAGLEPIGDDTICGTDDRVLSSDPRVARVMPVGCTGWIVDDCNRCFLTAGHCGNTAVVEFNVPPSSSSGSINHPSPDDQYAVDPASVQASATGLGDDWRYFGAFPNPNTGLTPAQAQGDFFTLQLPPNFGPGTDIRITGHGTDDTPPTSNQVQQTQLGPRVSGSGTVLRYETDTTGGNSGSPVIWEQSNVAIGIHTNGGCTSGGGSNSGTALSNGGLQLALSNPAGICAAGIQLAGAPPEILAPGVETKLALSIAGAVVPGSPTLHVSYDGGPFLPIPIVPGAGGLFEATLPPAVCGASPRYFFSVVDANCGTLTLPESAPTTVFQVPVGVEALAYADDMESDLGWTVGAPGDQATTGTWTRVNPNGTEAQPEDDHSEPGVNCWVTGQGAVGGGQGDNDVDGGATTLISPSLDLTGLADPTIDYWRWYSNDTGASPATDIFVIELSNDGGASWSNVETVGPGGVEASGGWFQHVFRVADVATPTADVRLRFVAADGGSGSIVEAALDDLRVRDVTCDAQLADCNQNGILDADDIASGRSLDTDGNGIPDECVGDCDGDGVPDATEIANGTQRDCNANGLPDECELTASAYCQCAAGAPCGNPDAAGGCANSTGAGAALAACGSGSVAADDLRVEATGLPANQNALVFMGAGELQQPFGDGLRCVGAGGVGVFRFPIRNAGAAGAIVEGPGLVADTLASFPPAGHIAAGQTWRFQAWYRDPSGPCGASFNLSNAVRVTFAP